MMRLLGPYAIGSFIAAILIGGALVYITDAERAKRALDTAKDYITGTEDARDATNDLPSDERDIDSWLRNWPK